MIKERYGRTHPELAPTLNNLAALLSWPGQLAAAATTYRRALAILEATVESDHPNLHACRANYTALVARQHSPRGC